MFKYILGILYIFFGILKFIICSIMLLMKNDNIIKKYNILKYFTINDYTFVTKVYFTIMMIFSIDIFLKGMKYTNLVKNSIFNNNIYIILGSILIFFFIFVIFFPEYSSFIQRNENNEKIYKSIYLTTGYIYIIVFLTYIMRTTKNYLILFISFILILLLLFIIMKLEFIQTIKDYKHELDSMIMIPLSSL